jgi:hypothetical protein
MNLNGIFEAGYFLRRPRITINIPDTSATALPAEPTPTSGTPDAIAYVDAPTISNTIPKAICAFCILIS